MGGGFLLRVPLLGGGGCGDPPSGRETSSISITGSSGVPGRLSPILIAGVCMTRLKAGNYF